MKNYNRAIEVLSQGSAEHKQAAIALVKQHGLFNKGIIIFKTDPVSLKQVKRLMAEHLINKEEINEAITIY
jgi:hypothetical protein